MELLKLIKKELKFDVKGIQAEDDELETKKHVIQELQKRYNEVIFYCYSGTGKKKQVYFHYHDKNKPIIEIVFKKQGCEIKENKDMEEFKIHSRADIKICVHGLTYFYDGEKYFDEKTEKYFVIDYSGVLKRRIKDGEIIEDEKQEIKTMYEKLLIDGDEITKKLKIDVAGCRYNAPYIAMELFYQYNKYFHGLEYGDHEEFDIIQGSSRGGMIDCLAGEIMEDTIKIDVNSHYPNCMVSDEFKIPMRKGEFITTHKIIFDYMAVYKLEVEDKKSLYFRNTVDNWYNSYQIEFMDALGIKYKLVKEFNNCYVYKNRVKGKFLFRYFEKLFKLKEKGNKLAKLIMNSTWGLFGWKKERTLSKNIENYEEDQITFRIPLNGDLENATITKQYEKEYKFPLARLTSLLFSYTKLKLYRDYIQPIEKTNKIYWIHTDGFITDMKLKTVEKILDIDPKKIGACKIEKEYNGKYGIYNTTRFIEIAD